MHKPFGLLAGRYRLDKVLGKGGMGQVWQGYDTKLERSVAVKEVTVPYGTSPDAAAVFYARATKEARNAARVSRIDDVATVFDVITDEDHRPWIIMDLLESLTLQQYIERHGAWSVQKLTKAAGRLLWVVDQIHRYGIVHRDFKPSNLMVATDDVLKILDFGIARFAGDTVTSDAIVGTVAYMPPEVLNNASPTAASDAWSLGVVLYYALTGVSPFERSTPEATMVAIMQHNFTPLEGDEPIHAVVRGLLCKDPDKRMSLDDAARMLGAKETVLLPAQPTKQLPRRRRGRVAAGAVAVVIAVAAGAVFIPTGQHGTRDNATGTTTSTTSSSQSSAASASAAASSTPVSSSPQAVGNVFTNSEMRIEAQSGWQVNAMPDLPTTANLSKYGEGYMRAYRTTGASLDAVAQQERAKQTNTRSPLSAVSYPKAGMALWSYRGNRFCGARPACGSTLVWSAVVAIQGGYVAISYNKQVEGDAPEEPSDDERAFAAISAAASWVTLL